MESPNSLYSNNINNTSKDGFESDNVVIPSNFLISTKEIIARFPHNKRVGHYLLGRKLGEGSFAKVKEGLQTLTGQKVAIKVIDKKKAKEDAYVSKNMRREGKLLQMIIHPNIIQLYELMETENSYYLVTELCEGGDLMDYICARKYLSEACTRKFIRQIISAVDYLHRIGILHRDLKIENLLLDKNLNIKLIGRPPSFFLFPRAVGR
jgi:Neu-associated kinase